MARFEVEVEHPALGRRYLVKGNDPDIVEARVQDKIRQFNQQYQRHLAAMARESEKERKADKVDEAAELTRQAEEVIANLSQILAHTLGVDDRVDFDTLVERSPFMEPPPTPSPKREYPPEPRRNLNGYVALPRSAVQGLIELVWPRKKAERLAAEKQEWQEADLAVQQANDAQHGQWKTACLAVDAENHCLAEADAKATAAWTARKVAHAESLAQAQAQVNEFRARYLARDASAIEEYFDLVLTHSVYPECFQGSFAINYLAQDRELVIDFDLPSIDALPTAKSFRYVVQADEIVATAISDTARRKLYESVVCQTTLRTLHEAFEADVVGAIDAVTFTGYVEAIDPATGNRRRDVVVAVTAKKAEFVLLNLAAVDPKACLRKLEARLVDTAIA